MTQFWLIKSTAVIAVHTFVRLHYIIVRRDALSEVLKHLIKPLLRSLSIIVFFLKTHNYLVCEDFLNILLWTM